MKRFLPLLLLFAACKQQDFNADLLVKNAVIYTVDARFSVADAFVVKGGKILAVGKDDSLESIYKARHVIDAGGKPVYPGFIDAHSHFYEYGLGLQEVNLDATKSWDEIVDSVLAGSKRNPDGWVIGRGWDQNKWKEKKFPDLFGNDNVVGRAVRAHVPFDEHTLMFRFFLLHSISCSGAGR